MSGVRRTGEGLDGYKARLDGFLAAHVHVGIPSDKDGPHPSAPGLLISDIAAIHEFGAPSVRIPERSFLRAGIRENLPAIRAKQADLVRQVANKKLGVSTALNRLGQFMADKVRDKLEHGPFVPLKQTTINIKGSSIPLIDTGVLRNAIGYEVTK